MLSRSLTRAANRISEMAFTAPSCAASGGSLTPLAAQLGAVKAISEILFAARVNDLESIQRVRVSDDDTAGLASDYIDELPITNDLAILTPYMVTFRSFTPELARVINGFADSPNPFIVKSVSVQPAGASTVAAAPGEGAPYAPAAENMVDRRYRRGYMPLPGAVPAPQQQPAGRGGLQTVLKEQLLRVTLEVEIVKLLPGN